jgi:hypothetical protein
MCSLRPRERWVVRAAPPRGPRIAGRHRLCVASSGLVEAKLEAKRSTADFGARGWAFRVNFYCERFYELRL